MKIYKKVILQMLTPMQKGYLHVKLEDGSSLEFGKKVNELHAQVEIINPAFYKRAFLFGDIGFAESYMFGEWNTNNLTNLLSWFLLNIDTSPTLSGSKVKLFFLNGFQFVNKIWHLGRKNSISGSKKNISQHYDLSNDFFKLFLDSSMTYSSALFSDPTQSLEDAQEEKYKSLCESIKLKNTDHVLEIGSGWGGFAIYAAKNYGCKITTVTVSLEQFNYAKEKIIAASLQDLIHIELKDYRFIEGQFDKVVSIEMIEAVGAKFLQIYFDKIQSVLKKDGILAIQAIVCPDSRFNDLKRNVDFIQKHIFPGSLLPSIAEINYSINKTGDLFLFGLKDLGKSYVQTLHIWQNKFNENIKQIELLGFDDVFIRKWNYYFSYCEAAFEMRNINVVQMIYSRPNNLTI